jgi:hypothetical protein
LMPPLFGVNISVAKTRKFAFERSPTGLPRAAIVHPGGAAPPPVAVTVNVHPAAMLPPETEHVNVAGVNRGIEGVTELEIETDVSAPLKPDPVMVTTVPIVPWSAVSEIIGPPVRWNVVVAVGPPVLSSWYCTVYVPDDPGATVKEPTTLPTRSWLHTEDNTEETTLPPICPAPKPEQGLAE